MAILLQTSIEIKTTRPEIFYTLKYEDLITNTENIMREICNFINVDFNDSILQYHKKINEHFDGATESFRTIHSGLRKPVNDDKIGLWKLRMKENDIKASDFVVGKYAEILGYERKFNIIS